MNSLVHMIHNTYPNRAIHIYICSSRVSNLLDTIAKQLLFDSYSVNLVVAKVQKRKKKQKKTNAAILMVEPTLCSNPSLFRIVRPQFRNSFA